jgi:hypothetical protein
MPRTTPVYPVAPPTRGLPTDQPTIATRRRYGTNALIGIVTQGSLAAVVPINHASTSAAYPAFPFAQPSSVAPDAIRVALLVARNLFSPNHHSTPPSTQQLVLAVPPGQILGSSATVQGKHSWSMPKKQLHGTGGWYTLPHPPNFPNWPDIMNRVIR